jgi:hypothetical protein
MKDSNPSIRLLYALYVNDPDLIKASVESGANVNEGWGNGHTSLSIAKSEGVAKVLLENGANVHIVDDFGCTALTLTESEGVMKLLLEHGAIIREKDIKETRLPSMKETLINAKYAQEIAKELNNMADPSQLKNFQMTFEDGKQLTITNGTVNKENTSIDVTKVFKDPCAVAQLHAGNIGGAKEFMVRAFVEALPEKTTVMHSLRPVLQQDKNSRLAGLPSDIQGMIGEYVGGRKQYKQDQGKFTTTEAAKSANKNKSKGRE